MEGWHQAGPVAPVTITCFENKDSVSRVPSGKAYRGGFTGTGPMAGIGFIICGGICLAAVSVSRVRLAGSTNRAMTTKTTAAREASRTKDRQYRSRLRINDQHLLSVPGFLPQSQKKAPPDAGPVMPWESLGSNCGPGRDVPRNRRRDPEVRSLRARRTRRAAALSSRATSPAP